MKILFVTHDHSIYGASKSLQTLLRGLDGDSLVIDVMITRRILRRNDERTVRSWFGPAVRNIFQYYLPFDPCEVGRAPSSLSLWLKRLLYESNKRSLLRFLRTGQYSIVHLNSLVLHQLIDAGAPTTIHIREIFDNSNPKVFERLRRARGIVFIDEATRAPFSTQRYKNAIVLNNPFAMSPAVEPVVIPGAATATVIAMIGRIKESKGNLFVIEAFKKVPAMQHSILLMVGEGVEPYLTQCKTAASSYRNIIFVGEIAEIERIYDASDFVIRGEAGLAIGRTIYEGLYSGCNVILPGSRSAIESTIEPAFLSQVYVYAPRDEESLCEVFSAIGTVKVADRKYHSNVKAYVEKFLAFVERMANPAVDGS